MARRLKDLSRTIFSHQHEEHNTQHLLREISFHHSSSSRTTMSLRPDALQKLQAGAFESLCQHLRDHSENVSNLDLMTLAGFCRNCLAKWMVLEARKDAAWNAFGYEEAAEIVYGVQYEDWKKRYHTKATDAQLAAYQASLPKHAQHDKELLAKKPVPRSNVCCQEVDDDEKPKGHRGLAPFVAPPIPTTVIRRSVCVLTVSDRASQGVYEDLSGPSVVQAVQQLAPQLPIQETVIVPDDSDAIVAQLEAWNNAHTLVLTTGGTGFAPRDVTPEATRHVLQQEATGLMGFVTNEASKLQPLASLSRGTAGVTSNGAIVANLPGNPKAVGEILPILLPLLLHMDDE